MTKNIILDSVVSVLDADMEVLLNEEVKRQRDTISLVASENCASLGVLRATGSVLTNKYAEGYPGHRYYNGCAIIDKVEQLAQHRACKLFRCDFANVQPHSGSQANQAVFSAFLNPGDKFMAMDLSSGGHLTHGAKVSISGQWFEPIFYGLCQDTELIDMNQVRELAVKHKPKLIIAGSSSYSRCYDFKSFMKISRETGALFWFDMAHYAGLVAGLSFPSPFPYADVVTSTTHKTLRGPRGGLILCNDANVSAKIDKAVFPGIQGGPLMHAIAAKAVAFHEALQPEFREYAEKVISCARLLAHALSLKGFRVVSGGTDCHMFMVDFSDHEITGDVVADALETANIVVNKNSIPFDISSPKTPAGIRLGTASCVARGMGEAEFIKIAEVIIEILVSLSGNLLNYPQVIKSGKKEIIKLARKFSMYST